MDIIIFVSSQAAGGTVGLRIIDKYWLAKQESGCRNRTSRVGPGRAGQVAGAADQKDRFEVASGWWNLNRVSTSHQRQQSVPHVSKPVQKQI